MFYKRRWSIRRREGGREGRCDGSEKVVFVRAGMLAEKGTRGESTLTLRSAQAE